MIEISNFIVILIYICQVVNVLLDLPKNGKLFKTYHLTISAPSILCFLRHSLQVEHFHRFKLSLRPALGSPFITREKYNILIYREDTNELIT